MRAGGWPNVVPLAAFQKWLRSAPPPPRTTNRLVINFIRINQLFHLRYAVLEGAGMYPADVFISTNKLGGGILTVRSRRMQPECSQP